jgi:hypothetical protein
LLFSHLSSCFSSAFFGRFWTRFCAPTILALFWLYFGFILALIWLYFGAHKQAGADLHFGFILGLTNKPGLTFILASIWG